MEILQNLVVVTFYAAACLSFGLRSMQLIGVRDERETHIKYLANNALAFLLGQGIFAAILQIVVALGWFKLELNLTLVVLALASGLNLLWWQLMRFPQILLYVLESIVKETLAWKIVINTTLLFMFLLFLGTLFPQIHGDARAVYMSFPNLIAYTGEYIPPPAYTSFTLLGIQGEYHYALLIQLGNYPSALIFTYITGLSGVLVLLGMCQIANITTRGKWIVIILAFTSTAFIMDMTNGKVDTYGAAMGIAAYYWALKFDGRNYRPTLYLAGLFVGLAIIAKLSYIPILPPTIIILLIFRYWVHTESPWLSSINIRAIVLFTIVVGLWAFIPMISHIIKNIIVFDEPFAPIIILNPEHDVPLNQVWFTQETTNRILLSYPFGLVYGRFWAQGGNISPLWLGFLPLIAFTRLPRPLFRQPFIQLIISSLIAVIVWMILRPSIFAPRYILSPLLILLLIPAYGVDSVFRKDKNEALKVVIILAILFATVVVGRFNLRRSLNSMTAIRTNLSDCGYASTCDAYKILEGIDQGKRVFVGSYFTLWLRPDLTQCSISHKEAYTDFPELDESEQWEKLYSRGFEYIVIDKATHQHLLDIFDDSKMPSWIHYETLYDTASYAVYHIVTTDPPYDPVLECVEIRSSVWEVQTKN